MSVHKDVYIFIGSPGSGKGTLSSLCVKELNWERLSTGELCRKHIAEQTAIGKEIDFATKSGKLISDALITSMVEQWFVERATSDKIVILDGYPRTVAQAKALDQLFRQRFSQVHLNIVHFVVSQDIVLERLGGRLICLNKDCQAVYSLTETDLKPREDMLCDICKGALGIRKDDKAEAILERLRVYPEHEKELLDYYRLQGKTIFELRASGDPLVVFEGFKKYVHVGVA